MRARVDGIVQRRLYTEGTDVREGQPLFAIDPRELRARANAAQAALAKAEATAANATQDVNRYKGLVAQQALSQQEYDAAVARLRTAEADVAQRRAELAAARLSLGYTTVTAPISGRAGRAEVTEGALVSGGAATLLTRIEQIDPIYANFSQSSSDVLALRAAGSRRARSRRPPRAPCRCGSCSRTARPTAPREAQLHRSGVRRSDRHGGAARRVPEPAAYARAGPVRARARRGRGAEARGCASRSAP